MKIVCECETVIDWLDEIWIKWRNWIRPLGYGRLLTRRENREWQRTAAIQRARIESGLEPLTWAELHPEKEPHQ